MREMAIEVDSIVGVTTRSRWRLMKLRAGQYVRHTKFGWGTILEDDKNQTTVYFNSVGVKRFVATLATFVVVQDLVPKKKRTTQY